MRKVINYGDKISENLIVALGYFDAVHKGHQEVLAKTVSLAKERNLTSAVLIFFGGKQGKDIFTLSERVRKIFATGIEVIIVKELTPDFLNQTKFEFLNDMSSIYKIDAVVSGSDFKFGKNASGNVETLIERFGDDNVYTVNLVLNGENKISSTAIKNALINGDIFLANSLLGGNYFISSKVIKGKMLGKTIGFPTANMVLDSDKLNIKNGVYITFTIIDGKLYKCITNFGAQPTVNGGKTVVETYIDGFIGDLYDKVLTVYFVEFLREIKKFDSVEELKQQLLKDLGSIK